MKKIISFLTALLLSVTAVSVCMAENTEALDASLLTVYATYKDEKVDVTRQVLAIPVLGGIALIYFLVWGRKKDEEE